MSKQVISILVHAIAVIVIVAAPTFAAPPASPAGTSVITPTHVQLHHQSAVFAVGAVHTMGWTDWVRGALSQAVGWLRSGSSSVYVWAIKVANWIASNLHPRRIWLYGNQSEQCVESRGILNMPLWSKCTVRRDGSFGIEAGTGW